MVSALYDDTLRRVERKIRKPIDLQSDMVFTAHHSGQKSLSLENQQMSHKDEDESILGSDCAGSVIYGWLVSSSNKIQDD